MTRPRASTVLRRFLDGASIGELAFICHGESRPHDYIERCIRRGLRGEIRIPAARRRRKTDWFRGSVRGVPGDSLRAQYSLALRADWGPLQEGCLWRPAIFMPRWASRITLEIAEVRVQRLQEIAEEDARAEGCRGVRGAIGQMIPGPPLTAREDFERMWDSINGKARPMLDDEGKPVLDDNDRPIMVASRSWSSNPWVWAVSFRRLS